MTQGNIFWTQQGSYTYEILVFATAYTKFGKHKPDQIDSGRGEWSYNTIPDNEVIGKYQLLGKGEIVFSQKCNP